MIDYQVINTNINYTPTPYVVPTSGIYQINYYLFCSTIGALETAYFGVTWVPLASLNGYSGTPIALNVTSAYDQGTLTIYALASTNITPAVAYFGPGSIGRYTFYMSILRINDII